MANRHKIETRARQLYENHDPSMTNMRIKPYVEQKLLTYQVLHLLNIASILKKSDTACAIDFSSTGTGKTYVSIALCAQFGYSPIIICPKSVICYWREVCAYYNVVPHIIVNYDAIKRGKVINDKFELVTSDIITVHDTKKSATTDNDADNHNNNDSDSDNDSDDEGGASVKNNNGVIELKRIVANQFPEKMRKLEKEKIRAEMEKIKAMAGAATEDNDTLEKKVTRKPIKRSYEDRANAMFTWNNIDKNKHIFIFDEAHKCKNWNTVNGKLLLTAKNKCRILLLSATIAQKPEDFSIFGYLLNFYKNVRHGRDWIKNIIAEEGFSFSDPPLIRQIYPRHGSRMTYSDMTCTLNVNNIVTKCYAIDDASAKSIDNEYTMIHKNNNTDLWTKNKERSVRDSKKSTTNNRKKINNKKHNDTDTDTDTDTEDMVIVKITKARRRIESIKTPIFIELIEKNIDSRSIVVFVNFLDTLYAISEHFTKKQIGHSIVIGDQDIAERLQQVNDFQNNVNKLILCTISAGSESISLHDTHGNNPRMSLISPSWSARELLQALGRIYRAGLKSPVYQEIVFCNSPTELYMCEKLREKIQFLNNFADYSKIDDNILSIEM